MNPYRIIIAVPYFAPDLSEFPNIYEENFLFFLSVYTVHAGGEEAILQNAVKRGDV